MTALYPLAFEVWLVISHERTEVGFAPAGVWYS